MNFPLKKFVIAGSSMIPTLNNNDSVLVLSYILTSPKIGDIVVAMHGEKHIIKRITKIKGNTFFLSGENTLESTDSRRFGFVNRHDIIGKVILKF